MARTKRCAVVLLFCWNGAGVLGCAAPVVEPKTPPVTEPARTMPAPVATPEPARSAEPVRTPAPSTDSSDFDEGLARLRPAGTEALLASLERAPLPPAAFGEAAIAYSTTDVPAMTLIWGMSYAAMAGGPLEKPVAQAMLKVLSERIVVQPDPNSERVDYNVRLAPGKMPVREHADGSIEAPLAHAFEGLFGAALIGFRPPWSVEEFYDVLSSWVGVISTRGTPIDPVLELNEYLVGLAKAGHLEAYCFRLLGSVFPAELKAYQATQAKALKSLDAYLKSTPFRPKRAALPDDLVRSK